MSQKIIIPKGTIDSTHTTIIEIPNYLHDETTVVVTMPKTADSALEQNWQNNEYNYSENSNVEQIEAKWAEEYETPGTNEETVYSPEQQGQYEEYQYPNEEVESGEETQQQVEEDQEPYANFAEETPVQNARRLSYDQNIDLKRKQVLDKKRELLRLKMERQKMLEGREGETGTYDVQYQAGNAEDGAMNMWEVPEGMRGRPQARDSFENEKRRQMREFERQQPHDHRAHPGHFQRDRSFSKYNQERQNQRYVYGAPQDLQQYNADLQRYPQEEYRRSGHQLPDEHQRRQPGQVEFAQDDSHQYQKARRRSTFNAPRN